jgi:hypothetical protein
MTIINIACWIALIAIHTMPALAFFQPVLVTKMYRLEAGTPLFLLMQHRAALFFIVCIICAWAIFRPETRQLASVAVAISMLSFLLLYWMQGSPSALRAIAIGDIIGLPFLAFVLWQAFRVVSVTS